MPKKKPIISSETRLLKAIQEGNSGLVRVQFTLSGHFKKTDPIRIEIDDLCRRYLAFKEKAVERIKTAPR